jgi:hypothetical protein
MDQHFGFSHYFRIESLARPVPSTYKPDKGVDRYVHLVAFNDPKDHEETIRNYLQTYCRVDPDSDDSRLRGLKSDHFMCANAILTYYLRSAINRIIEVGTTQHADDSDIPTDEPVLKTAGSVIWFVSKEENFRG